MKSSHPYCKSNYFICEKRREKRDRKKGLPVITSAVGADPGMVIGSQFPPMASLK